ncbi:MAG: hypothetical protein K1X47_02015 [Cyclobacteriaceae bacterium]|nr:hypothetical protein [Cyclobacteriaceae bacterium]
MEKMKGYKPRSIGPAGMSGRVTAIDVVLSNPDIIYAGTASGGLWKSTSGGINWEPLFDKEAVLSIGAVAVQQDNPSVIWVGTGEGNPRNSLNSGAGIYKSMDGGKTWKVMGLEKTRNIHRVIIDPSHPQTVYVAAIGNPWGEHPERGVYKTNDGGATWERILFVDDKTGCADLVMDPSNPHKLIAAMWQHRRWPWFFKSGGPGSGLFVTTDGGKTWNKRTEKDGLPEGELGRIGLTIAASKPDVVYAIVESKKNALYRSDDGGDKWTMINDRANEIGDRPFYYSDIHADPVNENRLYTIYSEVNVSIDGGKSFQKLLPYSGVHPDHHAWWIHPTNPNHMIDGNDGGLNITHDRGKNWRFVDNIPVGQFYHINVDMDFPYNVYGGLQDNGSWAGPSAVWLEDAIRNYYWKSVMFGDGFDTSPDPDDSRYGYAMSQGGFLGRYDKQTGVLKMLKPTHPDAKMKLRFNWNSGFAQDPFDKATIYYGSQFLHKSTDKGNTWEIISGDLTTNDPEKQKQHETGGLTMDQSGAENHCTILSVAPSALEKGVIWVGTDDGKIQLTRDGGKSWTDVTSKIAGLPKGAWVPQIQASTHRASEVFVVVNNYRQFDYKPYVFRSRDYGVTWESLVSGSQVGESNYTLAIVQDPQEPRLIFLGTENGLFVSVDEGKNYTRWTQGYPAGVSTMDLVIHPREHDLAIATFGRAVYILDDIRPLRQIAKGGAEILQKPLHLFTPGDAYQVTYEGNSPPILFAANGVFAGQNRPAGAMISYVVNRPEKKLSTEPVKKDEKPVKGQVTGKGKQEVTPKPAEEKERPKFDSLTLEVFNSQGIKIRTLKEKLGDDNGFGRMYWTLNEKAPRYPSRNKPMAGAPEPGGNQVLPGTYKLRLSAGGYKDSVQLVVKPDPRFNVPVGVYQSRYELLKELDGLTSISSRAADRIRESLDLVGDFEKKMETSKREDLKEALAKTKAMKDSLNVLMDFLLGKEDKRQGFAPPIAPTPVSYIGVAQMYVATSKDPVGATDERVMQHARVQIRQAIDRINAFYRKEWTPYQALMEGVKISPFKVIDDLR